VLRDLESDESGKAGELGHILDLLPDLRLYRYHPSRLLLRPPKPAEPARLADWHLRPPTLLLPDTYVTSGAWNLVSGTHGYNRRLEARKSGRVKNAEKTLGTASFRTSSPDALLRAMNVAGEAVGPVFRFYRTRWHRRERFFLYRRRTSIKAQLIEIIRRRVEQLDAIGLTVVSWGSGGQCGSFGKGNAPTPTAEIGRRVEAALGGKFEWGDEYHTSQKCLRCCTQVQKQRHPAADGRPAKEVHGIVHCKNGHTFNRDFLGGGNITNVRSWCELGYATDRSPRPPHLERPDGDGAFPGYDARAVTEVLPCRPPA